jgi:hypothetical protein
MKKDVLLLYRMIQGYWGLVHDVPILRPLEFIAVLRLCAVFREAYSTFILHVWYHLIDMHFIIIYMEFEDELSISVLKTRAIYHKHLHLEIVKFLKRSNLFKGRLPLDFTPRLFPTHVRRSRLSTMAYISNTLKRVKSWRWVKQFLLNGSDYG